MCWRHPDSRPRTKKCSLVLAYTSGTLLSVLESSWNLVFSPSGELSAPPPTNSKFSDPPLFSPWDYRIVWNDLKYVWKKPLLLYLWHFNLRVTPLVRVLNISKKPLWSNFTFLYKERQGLTPFRIWKKSL